MATISESSRTNEEDDCYNKIYRWRHSSKVEPINAFRKIGDALQVPTWKSVRKQSSCSS